MLDVQSVNVSYGDLQVLWNVSIKVNEGEIVALIGSNGAGKSTLLKTILSVLHPSSGSVTFLGERIDTIPAHKVVGKGISLVPEGRRLFPYMTVLENLTLGARSPKARKVMGDSIERAFEIFPALKERRRQLAKTLSGGEQQMLAISRALMASPKLFMLDEPSSGLGPLPTQKVFDVLRKINEDGTTVLLVEQSINLGLELAATAYLLENGRIALSGKREQILNDERVAKAYFQTKAAM